MNFLQRFQQGLLEMLASSSGGGLSANKALVVAYSGGLDSHVLLHACESVGLPVRAIHIHHGLQTEADAWVEHCRRVCRQLSVELTVLTVDARARARQSPEDAARIARYAALTGAMQPDEVLLTAQHADDQAETLLLQLLRGAGAAGLAAMPRRQRKHGVMHLRPLLPFTRETLGDYARQQSLDWIEDPSNDDIAFDRNYLRCRVLPVLKQRWPEVDHSFSVAAQLQQENLEVLEAMAAVDLAGASTQRETVLSLTAMKSLSAARQMNLLRYWLKRQGKQPTRKILLEIRHAVIDAADDASPLVTFDDIEIRRFRQQLYLLPLPAEFDSRQVIPWPPEAPLTIEPLALQLHRGKPAVTASPGLAAARRQRPLQVRFRQGGEYFRPAGHQHRQSLKKLFLQADIPPWERDRIPLIYDGDEMIAVAGYWLAQDACCQTGEEGWRIELAPAAIANEARGNNNQT
ncbi:MAG TPA: tRNA lysidine(34) synthetase TilS [Thiotrichales bacterium]|nr:tRNA lysidine(34) synthetase TilS [Thiotrichales bacterium]